VLIDVGQGGQLGLRQRTQLGAGHLWSSGECWGRAMEERTAWERGRETRERREKKTTVVLMLSAEDEGAAPPHRTCHNEALCSAECGSQQYVGGY